MSRIAGVVTGHVQPLLAAMRTQVPVTHHAHTLGRASLGVTTWREPNLALDGDVLAAVDSPLWSARDVIALYRKHGFVDALAQIDGDFAIALYANDRLW